MFFEFIVYGTPMSHQTENRARLQSWKSQARAAAARRWPTGQNPFVGSLQIVVDYYHDGPAVQIDGDNLLKPIQDALNRLAYQDDNQIVDARVRKIPLHGSFRISNISEVLAEALGAGMGTEFLHVQVAGLFSHQALSLIR